MTATLLQPDFAARANATDLATRSFLFDEVEVRDNPTTGGWTFEGVASVVNHPYPVHDRWGTYMETIGLGAFDRTLNNPDAFVALYVKHQNATIPLSTRDARIPMRLTADPNLRVVAELNPKRPDVQTLRYAVEDRILREMSIGFTPVKSKDKWNDSFTEVTRTQVTLREVSVVERGANTGGTEAKMRSLDELLDSMTDVDMDAADLNRGLAWFQERLAALTPAPAEDNEISEVLRQLRERHERHARERLSFAG